jgi:hypothetical protein
VPYRSECAEQAGLRFQKWLVIPPDILVGLITAVSMMFVVIPVEKIRPFMTEIDHRFQQRSTLAWYPLPVITDYLIV